VNGHSRPVSSVCFDHTGKKLASGESGGDKSVRLWSTESSTPIGSPLAVDSAVNSVAFCPDGSKIAAAHSNEIQIFDAQTKAKLGSPLKGHSRYDSYPCLFSNVRCVLTI
jgi:WD40 repeat protein